LKHTQREPEGVIHARASYISYLHACARKGFELKEFLSLTQIDGLDKCHWCRPTSAACEITYANIDSLVELVYAMCPSDCAALAEHLAKARATDLAGLLSLEVLRALRVPLEAVLAKLVSSPVHAIQWVTEDKLKALPCSARRLLCEGLTTVLDQTNDEVRAIIVESLV